MAAMQAEDMAAKRPACTLLARAFACVPPVCCDIEVLQPSSCDAAMQWTGTIRTSSGSLRDLQHTPTQVDAALHIHPHLRCSPREVESTEEEMQHIRGQTSAGAGPALVGEARD